MRRRGVSMRRRRKSSYRCSSKMDLKIRKQPRESRNLIIRFTAHIDHENREPALARYASVRVEHPAWRCACVVEAWLWSGWVAKAVRGADAEVAEIGLGVAVQGVIQEVDGEGCGVGGAFALETHFLDEGEGG